MAGYDAVVVGLGAMGSAALYHLARRGMRVLGLERHEPGHQFGSSHGLTRIVRLGYFEHPSYVPLLRRAYELWRELEAQAGRRLLHITGILELGPPEGTVVAGTLQAARLHGLSYDVLDARAVMQRFPAFRIPDHHVGVLQPDGGFLDAEPSILAHISLALHAGAELRGNTVVQRIEAGATTARVFTAAGVVEAPTVIVTAGAWTKAVLPQCPAPLRVTRQVVTWFEPREPALFAADRFPVFLLESAHGIHYGFPLQPAGLKIAKHFHADETVDPERYDRAVSAADEALIRPAIAEHLPAADGPLRAATTCLYTMTPDGDFVIGRLPGSPNVIVASPCSGHGFKFSGVIGEALAELAATGTTRYDLSRFRLARFG
jgi:sarcosine oxidase